jgi:hypothetical protein
MWIRGLLAALGASLLGACSGAVHQLPSIDQANLNLAQTEVARGGAPLRHAVTDEEVQMSLRAALEKIRPAATALCQQMAVGTCTWRSSCCRTAP